MNDKLDFNQAHPLKACRVEPVGEHPESRGPAQPIGGYVTFGNVWHVRKNSAGSGCVKLGGENYEANN